MTISDAHELVKYLSPEQIEDCHHTREDIRHVLYTVQGKLPEGISLDIDPLTESVSEMFPIVNEPSSLPQQNSRNIDSFNPSGTLGGAAGAVIDALHQTSKEHAIGNDFDVLYKENEINKQLNSIKETSSSVEKMQKTKELLLSLQRENLYESRKNDLIKRLQDAKLRRGEELGKKVQDRFDTVKQTRATSTNTSDYERYIDRLISGSLSKMNNDELLSYLNKYADKQLQGTHRDFIKLFSDKKDRKRFKFLGKQKEQIISVTDQNRIYKKQAREAKPVYKKLAEEYKRTQKEAEEKIKREKEKKQAELNALKESLHLKRIALSGIDEEEPVTVEESLQYTEESNDKYSGFDAINTANNLYSKYRQINRLTDMVKNLTKLFGGGGEVAEGGALLEGGAGAGGLAGAGGGLGALFANPYTWLVIGGIVVIFLLILIIFFLIQNNPTPTNTGPGQSLCPDATPSTAGQMVTILEQKFNMNVHGSDPNVISDLYTTSCKLSKYIFIQLMHVPTIKLDVYLNAGACTGHTSHQAGGYRVDINPCASSSGNEFIVTHEFAHVIQFENNDLVKSFCTQAYHGVIRFGHCESSNPSTIPTYNCLRDYTPNYDNPNPAECFSDMAGAFLTYKNFHDTIIRKGVIIPDHWQLMGDYPNNYTNYYNFASQNLFTPNTSSANSSQFVEIALSITQHLYKTFGRAIDLYDQIKPNPPGKFQLPNTPNPSYVVQMRGGQACAGSLGCVGSRYWCTDLLIDTYNIALGKRVLGEDLGTVENMINFWKKSPTSGFVFVHYRNANEHQSALNALYASKPSFGGALFFESVEGTHNGFEHVALIQNVKLDSTGNGNIQTYEANSGSKTGNYPIYHWQIKGTPYPVTGFGLYGMPGGGTAGGF